MRIQDPEEKLKARQDLVAGALGDKLKHLSKLVVSLQSYWLLDGKMPLSAESCLVLDRRLGKNPLLACMSHVQTCCTCSDEVCQASCQPLHGMH